MSSDPHRGAGIALLADDPWASAGSGAVLRIRDAIEGMRQRTPVEVVVPRLVARARWQRAVAAAMLVPGDVARHDHRRTAASTHLPIAPTFAYVAGTTLLEVARRVAGNAPVILDMFDVPSHLHRMHLDRATDLRPTERLLGRIDVRAWERFERRLADPRLTVVVASPEDAARLPGVQCRVIPNGYPAPETTAPSRRDTETMVFVGHLGYPPNRDAARFLVDEVLPLVLAARPASRLLVVGRQADRWIEPSPGVEVHADVPSTAPFLQRATVMVAPVRYGTGTRVKLLEAFAHRVPVVAHPIGAEGLGVVDGEHLRLATTADETASAVLQAFADAAAGGGAGIKRIVAAHAHWQQRFDSAVVRRAWSDLAASLAARSAR